MRNSDLPGGAPFAFTILDDTDDSTLENARPVYERLHALGFRTTKTVWPLECPEGSRHFFAADTLERPEYLEWVRGLIDQGFELGLHGATMESSRRVRTEQGLREIEGHFGFVPQVYANHGFNRENVYWGLDRFQTGWIKGVVRRLRLYGDASSEGQDPDSPYFWGDLCQRHVEYVRGFTFAGMDVRRFDPLTPYELESTPFVRYWFSTADAPDATAFKRRVTRRALDRLAGTGGVCILSTHLGKGFASNGRLDPEVDAVLTEIADRGAWRAPVSDVLDHLRRARKPQPPLSPRQTRRLEFQYLRDRVEERIARLLPSRTQRRDKSSMATV